MRSCEFGWIGFAGAILKMIRCIAAKGADGVRGDCGMPMKLVWCFLIIMAMLGACGGDRDMDVPLSNLAYPYTDLLRTLLPLRLASSLGGSVTAAVILYPANGKELAVFLHRRKDGQYHLTVFQAKTCLYAEVMEQQRDDVDAVRDCLSIAVQVSPEAASSFRALLDSEFARIAVKEVELWPDMSMLEVGLLLAGGEERFVRREGLIEVSSDSKLVELCGRLRGIEFEDGKTAQDRVLATLREAGLR
jgi:hypothetical protein